MPKLKRYVAAILLLAGPALAQDTIADLDGLFEQLARPEADHERIADRIQGVWSRSGSPSADLLLRRGREALDEGNDEAAIEHLTALVDHAPDFAPGYSARAEAYFVSGRAGEALQDIARVLELEPREFEALAGLGFILEDLGVEKGALRAYRAAAALNPGLEPVQDAIARIERDLEGEAI